MSTRRKITVETTGRTDLDDFFRLSGVLDGRLNHHPILAFVVAGDTVRVQLLDRATEVRGLPAETPLMAQWAGRWNSDFFHMTAGDVQGALVKRRP